MSRLILDSRRRHPRPARSGVTVDAARYALMVLAAAGIVLRQPDLAWLGYLVKVRGRACRVASATALEATARRERMLAGRGQP